MKKNILLIKNKNGLEFYYLSFGSDYLSNEGMARLKEKTQSVSIVEEKKEDFFKPYEKSFTIFLHNERYCLEEEKAGFSLNEILNVKLSEMSESKVIDFMIECNEKMAYIVNQNGYLFDLTYNEVDNVNFTLLEKEGCFVFNDRELAVKKAAEVLQESEDEVMCYESICLRKLNSKWIEYNERYEEDLNDEDFEPKEIEDKIINYTI